MMKSKKWCLFYKASVVSSASISIDGAKTNTTSCGIVFEMSQYSFLANRTVVWKQCYQYLLLLCFIFIFYIFSIYCLYIYVYEFVYIYIHTSASQRKKVLEFVFKKGWKLFKHLPYYIGRMFYIHTSICILHITLNIFNSSIYCIHMSSVIPNISLAMIRSYNIALLAYKSTFELWC